MKAWVGYLVLLGLFLPAAAHDLALHAPIVQPAVLTGAARTVSVADSIPLTVRLLDENAKPVAGLLRITDRRGIRIICSELLPRATGLTERSLGEAVFSHLNSWSVIRGEAALRLPREVLRIEAFSGLESRLTTLSVDLQENTPELIHVPITRFYDREAGGFVAGNVHLHLQQMTLPEAEAYTTAVAPADGLDLAFFSYLERAEVDEHYISNNFTPEDLKRFHQSSGVAFSYGEEYRHNFIRNEGYGHVMFLDLWKPVLPASFGPSITKKGNDDGVLRTGIHEAHKAGATVLWCHNTRGLEDIPNWIAGLLHGQIFFEQDGAPPGHDGIYSYLDIGLKVPVSTGTDWFFRDMAMTYVQSSRPVDDDSWLAALREGKSFMTNGPLLEFSINESGLGETVVMDGPGPVQVQARGVGRIDFQRLELLQNGNVIATADSQARDGFFEATFDRAVDLDASAWLAVRIPTINVDYNRPELEPAVFNEYGKPLFAHTSPIYVSMGGKPVFVADAARRLRNIVRADKATIKALGQYSSKSEQAKVLAIYDEAITALTGMLEQ